MQPFARPPVAVIGEAAKAAHNGAMRRVLAILFMLGLVPSGTARADQDDPRLPALFERLKTVDSDAEARLGEALIWQIWSVRAETWRKTLMQRGLPSM